jgi:hypothetical protein
VSVWTFDDFEPGAPVGEATVDLDARRLDLWRRLHGSAEGVPSGVILAAMMEAYIAAIQPRPKGNVHAGQSLAFNGRRPDPGAALRFAFACRDKALKRGRRWVWLDLEAGDDGGPVATGTIAAIWAA